MKGAPGTLLRKVDRLHLFRTRNFVAAWAESGVATEQKENGGD